MRIILAAAGAAMLPLAFAAPAVATDSNASVAVFHGVPGLTVDVYANGEVLLEDFEPGTITDPVSLPAGDYDLTVYAADADPASAEVALEANDVSVPAGSNVTVAAHLDADGNPVLTPFVNDVSTVPAGQGRLTVRHTAAAPAVDVLAGDQVVFSGLTNPNGESTQVPAGTVNASVALAGTDTVVIGPADVPVNEGSSTIVYAWGSAADENLAVAVQTISGLDSAPSGVPSGEAGLVGDALPWQLAVVVAAGAGLALVAGSRLSAARARD